MSHLLNVPDSSTLLFIQIEFRLIPDAQIWPRALNQDIGGTTDAVYLIIGDIGSPSGSGLDFVNGFAFLERFYSVFDTGNQRVGFATTAITRSIINFWHWISLQRRIQCTISSEIRQSCWFLSGEISLSVVGLSWLSLSAWALIQWTVTWFDKCSGNVRECTNPATLLPDQNYIYHFIKVKSMHRRDHDSRTVIVPIRKQNANQPTLNKYHVPSTRHYNLNLKQFQHGLCGSNNHHNVNRCRADPQSPVFYCPDSSLFINIVAQLLRPTVDLNS